PNENKMSYRCRRRALLYSQLSSLIPHLFFAPVSGSLQRLVRPTSRLIPTSVYLYNHIAYGYFRRHGTKVGGVFGNPVLCLLNALVDASPIVADRHGDSLAFAAR